MMIRSSKNENSVTFTFTKGQPRNRTQSILSWAGLQGLLVAVIFYFDAISGSILFPIILAIFAFLSFPQHTIVSESVMAIRDVGLQLTVTYSNGQEKHAFIPSRDIKDVVINEAPAGFVIKTYLVIVGKKEKNFLPFEHTDLPIKTSAQVLFGLRAVLFSEDIKQRSSYLFCVLNTAVLEAVPPSSSWAALRESSRKKRFRHFWRCRV